MISLSRADSSHTINLSRAARAEAPREVRCEAKKASSLDLMPQYRYDLKTTFMECYEALSEFNKEYCPVQSATYICELKKQARQQGDEEKFNALENKRNEISRNIRKMRREVYSDRYQTFEERMEKLKKYIKENGSYMNCSECADIMLEKLRKRGLKADRVSLYSINGRGDRTNIAEHVFTVAGIKQGADIKKPETWGDNAIIVDGWAGICMSVKDGLSYYNTFFDLKNRKQKMTFEYHTV